MTRSNENVVVVLLGLGLLSPLPSLISYLFSLLASLFCLLSALFRLHSLLLISHIALRPTRVQRPSHIRQANTLCAAMGGARIAAGRRTITLGAAEENQQLCTIFTEIPMAAKTQ